MVIQFMTIGCVTVGCARRWSRMQIFTAISMDSFLVYDDKYYLPVYLDKCAYKVEGNQMIDYLDDNLFEADED